MILGMIMLIMPLWVLALVKGTLHRLSVITAFTIVFLGLVAFVIVAKPFFVNDADFKADTRSF